MSVYASPNEPLGNLKRTLEEIEQEIKTPTHPPDHRGISTPAPGAGGTLITTGRGRLVENWASANRLLILNRGSTPTCVRWQGTFIVDITMANSAAARKINGWRVADVESLSDHAFLTYKYTLGAQKKKIGPGRPKALHW